MILANGCNITKSEKFKGVWILSIPTVYIYVYGLQSVYTGRDSCRVVPRQLKSVYTGQSDRWKSFEMNAGAVYCRDPA